MKIDIKKAFRLPFTEIDWPQKILVAGAFFFIVIAIQILGGVLNGVIQVADYSIGITPALRLMDIFINFLIFTLTIVTLAIPIGYVLQSSHNEIKGEGLLLPDWEPKLLDYFKHGIYLYAIKIIYLFLIALIIAIPATISAVIFNLYQNNPIISLINLIFIALFITPFVLFYIVIFPFIVTAYTENFEFQDAFKLDLILISISKVLPDYLVSIGLTIALLLLLPLLLVVFTCTCIGLILVPFLILPVLLIILNLFSQAYRVSKQEI